MNYDPLTRIAEQVPDGPTLTKRRVDGQLALRVMITTDELENALFAGFFAGIKEDDAPGESLLEMYVNCTKQG